MNDSRLARYHQTPKHKHSIIKLLVSLIIAIMAILIAIFIYYGLSAPKINSEVLQSGGSSSIYDQHGHEITTLGNQNRTYVTIDKVPQNMRNAVVSIEDRHFYKEHFGVNPIRILLAAVNNLRGGQLQGGSTLTQQLIKLSVFSTKKSDQTIKRKMQEVWLAAKVERNFSKDQILEYYMNKVYLANGTYGFQTAAQYYFGHKLNQLTLPQIALLAGMPQAPNNYNPYSNPQAAKKRRDNVLQAMYDNHKISANQLQFAQQTPITTGLKPYRPNSGVGENKMIVDSYIKQVIQETKAKGLDPYRDNLKITVNMNLKAQKYLYDLVNNDAYGLFNSQHLQTAVSVVDPNSGAVVAMIGGRKLGNVQLGLNRAVQTTRSNGSTMKPILDYGPAIQDLKWSTNHIITDEPYTYPGTNIALQNWDHSYDGAMTIRTALAQSRNVPAIKTLQAVGFNKARKFANNLGINVPYKQGLSAGIGSDVSSLQLASAYSAFANGGTYHQPQYISKIQTTDGLVHDYDTSSKKAMSAGTAYMITDILKDVVQPSGMGSQAYISGLHQAGKTGTTNYSDTELAKNPALSNTAKDSWFAGFTKHYAIGVWTGFDNPSQAGVDPNQQKIAGQVYQRLMRYLAASKTNSDWKKPHSVVRVSGTNVLYLRSKRPKNLPPARHNTGHSSLTNAEDNDAVIPNRGTGNNDSEVDSSSESSTNTTDGNSASSNQPDTNNNHETINDSHNNSSSSSSNNNTTNNTTTNPTTGSVSPGNTAPTTPATPSATTNPQ